MTSGTLDGGGTSAGETEQNEDVSRRDMVMKLLGAAAGGVALEALAGCANQIAPGSSSEPLGEATEALSGTMTTYAYADSITALRSAPSAVNRLAVLQGSSAAADGGGGMYYWSGTNAQDDGFNVVNPTAGTNVAGWRRIAGTEVPTIAKLRTLIAPSAANPSHVVLGFAAPADGGGGLFVWDPTEVGPSPTGDDGGTIIKPNSITYPTAGRWKRLHSGSLNVKWFGAKGDGSQNDRDAIVAAIASAQGTVEFPPGVYKVNSTIIIDKAVRLVGVGAGAGPNNTVNNNDAKASIIEHAFDGDLFVVTSSLSPAPVNAGTEFENLLLRQANLVNSGTAIKLTVAPSAPSWVRIRNVVIDPASTGADWYYGIWVDGSGGADGIRDVWIENVRIASGANANAAIYLYKAKNVFISNTLLNTTNARILIDGGSNSIRLMNLSAAAEANYAVYLDDAANVEAFGGIWNSLTTTGRTKRCALYPALLEDQNGLFPVNWNATESMLLVGCLRDTVNQFAGRMTLWSSEGVEVRSGALRPGLLDLGAQPPGVDSNDANTFVLTATSSQVTIPQPTSGTPGQILTITIRNATGAALSPTVWDAHFKKSTWTDPANGYSRSISFVYYGGNWVEVSRTPSDVPF